MLEALDHLDPKALQVLKESMVSKETEVNQEWLEVMAFKVKMELSARQATLVPRARQVFPAREAKWALVVKLVPLDQRAKMAKKAVKDLREELVQLEQKEKLAIKALRVPTARLEMKVSVVSKAARALQASVVPPVQQALMETMANKERPVLPARMLLTAKMELTAILVMKEQ